MADLDPSLAQKVLDADVRNLVKKVGDGGTLNSTDRQIFLGMAEGNLSPDAIREARVLALVRKHMDGGRLSQSERDEVSHLLHDATSIITEAVPLPQRSGALTQDEIERIYELSRAKYFRWRQTGQAVAEGPDLPPFDEPKGMVAWYERMLARGTFKHKCPKRLLDLANNGFPAANAPPSKATAPRPSQASSQSSSPPQHREAPERRGFLVEHEKLEEHTAILREDYLDAYARNDIENGNLLKVRYFEAYEMLRKSASQKEPIGLAERSLVKTAHVTEILSAAIPAAIDTLASEAESRALFEAAQSLTFEDFHKARRARIKGSFSILHKSGFVPPLELAS